MLKFHRKKTYNTVTYFINNYKLFTRKRKDYLGNTFLLNNINKKLSMVNNIWRNNNTLFYVPNYPIDLIQQTIVNSQNYFEIEILKELDAIIPDQATILDIGANIGNHTLYWAKERNAQKILCFEPIKETFDILQKNIELNKLNDVVQLFNVGISNENGFAKIAHFTMNNMGATSIQKDNKGELKTAVLDDCIKNQLAKIDFIKIDVEGHELEALSGAQETIKKYRPILFIEILQNKEAVIKLLSNLDYLLTKEFSLNNYLFTPKK